MIIKKLCAICLISTLLIAPAMAQSAGGFKPKKGDWQVGLQLGGGSFFSEDGLSGLLPRHDGDLGLGDYWGGTTNQSEDPGVILDLGSSFNDNSIVNIAGFQGGYFLTDQIQLTASFSMDFNYTPKKDYVAADYNGGIDDPLNSPAYEYIDARLTNKMMLAVGGNYYFNTRNERINLYGGALLGYQMGHIQAKTPYTGEDASDGEPAELYRTSKRAGDAHGIRAALNAGAEYLLTPGLFVALEFQPFAYNYTLVGLQSQGHTYRANHHNYRIFSYPTLKFGVRF